MKTLRIPRSPKVILGLIIIGFFLLLMIIGPYLAPFSPDNTSFAPNLTPSAHHWFGTTSLGQDIFSQTLVGARATMLVALVAGLAATVFSIVVGIAAGYIGGVTDDGLSLLSNVFLAIPGLPLLIVIDSYLPVNSRSNSLVIGLIISLTGWAWGARVLRAQTMSLRNRDFVEASRIIGESRFRVMFFEVAPNLLPILALVVSLYLAVRHRRLRHPRLHRTHQHRRVELGHDALLGAGEQRPRCRGEWYWFIPPGICIALVGTGLALLNFGIDEFINPRLRAAGLSGRQRRRAGLPRRQRLGLTPVIRRTNVRTGPLTLSSLEIGDIVNTESIEGGGAWCRATR